MIRHYSNFDILDKDYKHRLQSIRFRKILNLFLPLFSVTEFEQSDRDPWAKSDCQCRRDPRRTQHGSPSHRRTHALSDNPRHSLPGKYAMGHPVHAGELIYYFFVLY